MAVIDLPEVAEPVLEARELYRFYHSGDDETTGPVREHLHLLEDGESLFLAVIHLPEQGP